MAFAQNSRSRLSYGVQADFDTMASSFTKLPFSTHSLSLTKERLQGTDINSDRMRRVDRHGNRQTSGDIVVDLRAGDFDDFLEAAMLGSFTADKLKTGTTPKYLTIEDYAADIDQVLMYKGQTVSSMAISIAPNQMITATFTMVGKGVNQTTSERTVTQSSGAVPFDSYSGVVKTGDTGNVMTNDGRVSALDFTVANNFAPTFVIGSVTTPQLSYGMSTIEGTITTFYEDDSMLNRFLNETETALSVSVNDPTGSNEYTFFFPRIKINSGTVGVSGEEGSRMVEASFVALYDDTEGTDLSITRPTP